MIVALLHLVAVEIICLNLSNVLLTNQFVKESIFRRLCFWMQEYLRIFPEIKKNINNDDDVLKYDHV